MKSWTWFVTALLVTGCTATESEQIDDPEGPDLDEESPAPPETSCIDNFAGNCTCN